MQCDFGFQEGTFVSALSHSCLQVVSKLSPSCLQVFLDLSQNVSKLFCDSRRAGRGHQGLGCTGQWPHHRQESMGDLHNNLELRQDQQPPHIKLQDQQPPHIEIKLHSIDLFKPNFEPQWLLPHSCSAKRAHKVPGMRRVTTLRRVEGIECLRPVVISLTAFPWQFMTRVIRSLKGLSMTLRTASRALNRWLLVVD